MPHGAWVLAPSKGTLSAGAVLPRASRAWATAANTSPTLYEEGKHKSAGLFICGGAQTGES